MPRDQGNSSADDKGPARRKHRAQINRASTAFARTRVVSACQVCRARRTRCDNDRPCASCRQINAVCSYDPITSTAAFDAASIAILDKLQHLRNELTSLSGYVRALPGSQANPKPVAGDLQSIPNRVRNDPLQRTSSDTQRETDENNNVDLRSHLHRGNLAQCLAWPVWQPHHPPDMSAGVDQPHETDSPQPSMMATWACDPSLFNTYLKSFFRQVHTLNPVLDQQQIQGQLTQALLGGVGWDASSCLLLLVLANGAAVTSYGHASPTNGDGEQEKRRWLNAQALYEAAEKRKDSVWRGPYLTQARCHFYSGVFMMRSMRPFEAWRHFLMGLATCQRLTGTASSSLPLSLGGGPSSPRLATMQAEESIHWSCWKSERELRFELDMPVIVSSGPYDHPIRFPTLPKASDYAEVREWYFYLAEISLWRYEMAARETMAEATLHGPLDLESFAERIQELDHTLASWQSSLPAESRLDMTADLDTDDLLLFVLRGRLTYNYEVLTWPFLEHRLLFENCEEGPQSAKLVEKGVLLHYNRLLINRPGFYYQHHGTWLMRQSSARSTCVLLAVARNSSLVSLLPADWRALLSDTISMLDFWGRGIDKEVAAFLNTVFLDTFVNKGSLGLEKEGGTCI